MQVLPAVRVRIEEGKPIGVAQLGCYTVHPTTLHSYTLPSTDTKNQGLTLSCIVSWTIFNLKHISTELLLFFRQH